MSTLEANFIQKYNKYTLSQLLKLVTTKVNANVRERDTDEYGCITCISCKMRYPAKGMHCGHYRASTYSATRFYLPNLNGQCVRCNMHLHGNLIPYRENLINKIGLAEVEHIEQMSLLPYKWDRFSLINILYELSKDGLSALGQVYHK